MHRTRYCIVGCGSRHRMFAKAISQTFSEHAEIAALCDSNEGRSRLSASQHFGGADRTPCYSEADFERMIADSRPDVVIVTTRDCFHDKFIVRAMELGCDVVTEKPMTIDEVRCQRIVATAKKTGRSLRVTFNYRYSPPRSQVKDMLMDGVIGRVISVQFNWLLDTRHGADYFRRWHRNKQNSGGLMVHKATHHFDLVNWWLSSTPRTVFASGSRQYYTPVTAELLGLSTRSERCLGCPEQDNCKFYIDIERPGLKEMYRDCEEHDGYYRDRCVFSDQIDIEDNMSLTVQYDSGVCLAYSLNAFCPKEGYRICFNGTQGRLEHTALESSYVSGEAGSKVHETIKNGSSTWVFPHFSEPYQVELWSAQGGHGGGDAPLLEDIFLPEPPQDKLKRSAGYVEGAYSILTGVAANKSMRSGQVIRVSDLVDGLDEPDFTPMPSW